MPSASRDARNETQSRALTTSGAGTAPTAKADTCRAGPETLPSRMSRMIAWRAAPDTAVSVRAERSAGVVDHEALDAADLVGEPRTLRGGHGFEHRDGVPLKLRVHWRAPAPLAAVPSASARSAATASSMRSRCASVLTSRPMIRSTTSSTSSPIRSAASSTAR